MSAVQAGPGRGDRHLALHSPRGQRFPAARGAALACPGLAPDRQQHVEHPLDRVVQLRCRPAETVQACSRREWVVAREVVRASAHGRGESSSAATRVALGALGFRPLEESQTPSVVVHDPSNCRRSRAAGDTLHVREMPLLGFTATST